MARYSFDLKYKEQIDEMRSPKVYQFNMAVNQALLSNDASVIRRFFQVGVPRYYSDQWLIQEINNLFMAHYEQGQAFTYFGIVPMIVQGKVNLLASNGFECKSDDKAVDDAINRYKDLFELEKKFVDGVYWESGIGDVAFRVSYLPELSNEPIVDIIEPQHLEVNYSHGHIKSFIVKEVSSEDASYELHEIHYKNEEGYACIDYRFKHDGKYVDKDDESMVAECRSKFDSDLNLKPVVLPIKDFLIIYKQNANNSKLYKGERGVPDIQGMLPIEDALTECASDLTDAIRKGGVKEWVSDELLPQNAEGKTMGYDVFKKTIITTKGSSTPGDNKNLIQVTQGQINWEAYTRTIQNLMSIAINKAGLAPTTLGLTGLESINSSAESQDAREKTSLRTREVCLNGWRKTLTELLNRCLQVHDYINGKSILDYTDLINIQFNEYSNPSLENVTDVLAKQVQMGLKSQYTAIKELNDGMSDEQVDKEFMQIQAENGQPVLNDDGTQTGGGNPTQRVMLYNMK